MLIELRSISNHTVFSKNRPFITIEEVLSKAYVAGIDLFVISHAVIYYGDYRVIVELDIRVAEK